MASTGLPDRARHGNGLTTFTAPAVTVDADVPEVPVGIDGETVMMPTPVHCAIRPRALRVIVPRQRPGVPEGRQPLEWPQLRYLASVRRIPDGAPATPSPAAEVSGHSGTS